jgi:hypothetical protein
VQLRDELAPVAVPWSSLFLVHVQEFAEICSPNVETWFGQFAYRLSPMRFGSMACDFLCAGRYGSLMFVEGMAGDRRRVRANASAPLHAALG